MSQSIWEALFEKNMTTNTQLSIHTKVYLKELYSSKESWKLKLSELHSNCFTSGSLSKGVLSTRWPSTWKSQLVFTLAFWKKHHYWSLAWEHEQRLLTPERAPVSDSTLILLDQPRKLFGLLTGAQVVLKLPHPWGISPWHGWWLPMAT